MGPAPEQTQPNGDPEQPAMECGHWVWPGPEGVKRKAVPGTFVTDKYLTPFDGVVPDVGCKGGSKSNKGGKAGKKRSYLFPAK